MCALNYIPEPIKHTKLVFSAILLSFALGSRWDQLLYAITQLLASYLWPSPEHAMFDLLWVLGLGTVTKILVRTVSPDSNDTECIVIAELTFK